MSLSMSKQQREQFLADLHVGVVSMNRKEHGPLSAPIWYDYVDGLVGFTTGQDSRKGKLMQIGDRISMVAQSETAPYQYVLLYRGSRRFSIETFDRWRSAIWAKRWAMLTQMVLRMKEMLL